MKVKLISCSLVSLVSDGWVNSTFSSENHLFYSCCCSALPLPLLLPGSSSVGSADRVHRNNLPHLPYVQKQTFLVTVMKSFSLHPTGASLKVLEASLCDGCIISTTFEDWKPAELEANVASLTQVTRPQHQLSPSSGCFEMDFGCYGSSLRREHHL